MGLRVSITAIGVIGLYFFAAAFYPGLLGREGGDLSWGLTTVGVGILGLTTAAVLTGLRTQIASSDREPSVGG